MCILSDILTPKFLTAMSEFISLAQAIEMTRDYRANRNEILQSEYQDRNILCICETIEKSEIDDLFQQEGAVKLRIYYGMNEDLTVHAVLVAVDDHNRDILPDGEEMILDNSERCPDDCPPASPLNS